MAEAGRKKMRVKGGDAVAAVRPAAACGTRAACHSSGCRWGGGSCRCFDWYDLDVADDELVAALEQLAEVERTLQDIAGGSDSEVLAAWIGPLFPRLALLRGALHGVQDILSGGGR